MKKAIALISAGIMALSYLAACGSSESSKENSSQEESKSAQEQLAEIQLEEKKQQDALKFANGKAKLVFTTLSGDCADYNSDGKQSLITVGTVNKSAGDLNREDVIEKSLLFTLQDDEKEKIEKIKDSYSTQEKMSDEEFEIYMKKLREIVPEGKVAYEISEDYRPKWAQWVGDDGIVGQYPDPNTDPEKNYVFGMYHDPKYDL